MPSGYYKKIVLQGVSPSIGILNGFCARVNITYFKIIIFDAIWTIEFGCAGKYHFDFR